ncbi:ABC transporter substrate-binding protein [Nocardiopsis rhodophaea]|uniref:ABC transporter substrate-binding protein n=1 Tax=Nocardiopsis rhodophaea TaxID=280238 RepID=A0ABP5F683_9ACTN
MTIAGHPAPAARRRGRIYRMGALAAGLALFATACGGGGGDGDAGQETTPKVEVEADAELAAMVPQEYRDAGKLVIGVNAEYPPGEFMKADGKTVTGFNVDLLDAAAGKLDLETEWKPSPFDAIITGVQAGKFDVGMSSVTINEERLEQVNMVSYYSAGTQWFTQKGNPQSVDPDNACGKRVAVQKATIQVEDVKERSEKCVDDGKAGITIEQYQEQTHATESVVSGKNDAALADTPVAGYAVKQTGGKLETLGEQYESAPYGAVINKDDTELAEAIAAAYTSLIEDGTYSSILEEWGVEAGAITTPAVNPDVDE